MKRQKTLRGKLLDEAIDALLAQMLSLGLDFAPISRPEIQRRLGLTSRATLVGERGHRIDSARIIQLKEGGRDPDNARLRRTSEETIAKLKMENSSLLQQRDRLYEALCVITNRCILNGSNVEDILSALQNR